MPRNKLCLFLLFCFLKTPETLQRFSLTEELFMDVTWVTPTYPPKTSKGSHSFPHSNVFKGGGGGKGGYRVVLLNTLSIYATLRISNTPNGIRPKILKFNSTASAGIDSLPYTILQLLLHSSVVRPIPH